MMRNQPTMRILGIIACLGALFVLASALEVRPGGSSRSTAAAPGMVLIDGGEYVPLYRDEDAPLAERVAPYQLSAHPVTNEEFLAFVQANPSWQRSRAAGLFVDDGYLSHWLGDLDFGPDSLGNRPVVNVSWFAAQAYATWRGARLPTTAEWELAAAAGPTPGTGTTDGATRQRLLAWYGRPAPDVLPPVGSTACNYWGACDLHGLVWEWVDDFNSSLVTGESRNDGDLDLRQFCGSSVVGATDFDDYTAFLRFGFRSGLEARYTVRTLGFRIAADVPTDEA